MTRKWSLPMLADAGGNSTEHGSSFLGPVFFSWLIQEITGHSSKLYLVDEDFQMNLHTEKTTQPYLLIGHDSYIFFFVLEDYFFLKYI